MARVGEITDSETTRLVFNPTGGDGVNALAQATANGGTIFTYGMLSGQPTPLPMSAFGRRIAMYGYTFQELKNTSGWEEMKRLIYDHIADDSFKPEVARTIQLADTVEAYRYLEGNEQIGKVVITFLKSNGRPL